MFTGVFTLGNKVSTFYAPKTGFFVKVVGFKGMKADFTPEGIDACVASMKETNAKSITFACTPSFDSSSAYLVGVHVTLGVLHADDDSFDSKLEKMKNWIAKVPTDFTPRISLSTRVDLPSGIYLSLSFWYSLTRCWWKPVFVTLRL